MVAETRGSTVGLIVDGVSEVLYVPKSAIEPPSPVTTTRETTYLWGIARLQDRLVALLDLEYMLHLEFAVATGDAA